MRSKLLIETLGRNVSSDVHIYVGDKPHDFRMEISDGEIKLIPIFRGKGFTFDATKLNLLEADEEAT